MPQLDAIYSVPVASFALTNHATILKKIAVMVINLETAADFARGFDWATPDLCQFPRVLPNSACGLDNGNSNPATEAVVPG